MRTLLVGYDLNRPLQNYPGLIAALKASGYWWHHLDSTWLVRTTMSCAEMTESLRAHVDGNDELLVIDVTSDSWAAVGFTDEANAWLYGHMQVKRVA